MSRSVGRNVSRKDGAAKVAGSARYVDDLTRPGMLHARTIRSTIPCGDIARVRLDFDTTGFTIVDARDIPGRNVVSLIIDDQPCLAERRGPARGRADAAARPRGPGAAARRPSWTIDYRARHAGLRPGAVAAGVQDGRHRAAATSTRASGAPTSSSRASTGPATRSSSTSSPTACSPCPSDGGVTVYGSLQCPYYVHKALCVLLGLPADEGARGAGRNRRRLRRQGGLPVDDRRPRGAAGAEVGPAGEARLRPRRGHAGHDQAPPVDRPASHRRDARRPPGGDGHRRADGRRRLLHAEPGGAVARLPARDRAVPLRPRPRPRPRRDDQHAAQRRVPRLRRAADAVCRRGPHGAHRRGAGHGPACASARSTRCGPATRRRPGRCSGRMRRPSTCCARPWQRSDFHRKRRGVAAAPNGASASRSSSTAPASPAAAR